MKVKDALIALALGALSLTCVAGELIVHTVSRHSQYNRDVTTTSTVWQEYMWVDRSSTIRAYNNQNYGLGWRTEDGVIFGAYHNSYYRVTVYLGREYMATRHLGGFVGLATGYKNPISPIGGLLLKVPLVDRTSLQVMGTPRIGRVDGVVHAAVSYRF